MSLLIVQYKNLPNLLKKEKVKLFIRNKDKFKYKYPNEVTNPFIDQPSLLSKDFIL